ncbi:DUF1045 domain-containing protein [Neptunicoccus sediminis]|uniref:DUF1045 domain-containing protein n=1 Tax=Neptunicoccus sediminis TaxID=1892596 RepID=UPI000845DA34|nr:DUF1045 domain-containing protein [Neptunicoccus sediminis]
MYQRYAVYFTPPSGHPLGTFGAGWLGWDITAGKAVPHLRLNGLPLPVEQITATPRGYGLHGTLKAPFILDAAYTQQDLYDALQSYVAAQEPVAIGRLQLDSIGQFLALRPKDVDPAFPALVADCVMALDRFRAPMGDQELHRRRAANLSPRQDELLRLWGYPYVLDEFRFHVTLTGSLSDSEQAQTRAVLEQALEPHLTRPFTLDALCLCGQLQNGCFQLIKRYPLTG